eukprot:1881177-Rhodomonas_salina.2
MTHKSPAFPWSADRPFPRTCCARRPLLTLPLARYQGRAVRPDVGYEPVVGQHAPVRDAAPALTRAQEGHP